MSLSRNNDIIGNFIKENARLQLEIMRLEEHIASLRIATPKLTASYNALPESQKQLVEYILSENGKLQLENLRTKRRLDEYEEMNNRLEDENARLVEMLNLSDP